MSRYLLKLDLSLHDHALPALVESLKDGAAVPVVPGVATRWALSRSQDCWRLAISCTVACGVEEVANFLEGFAPWCRGKQDEVVGCLESMDQAPGAKREIIFRRNSLLLGAELGQFVEA